MGTVESILMTALQANLRYEPKIICQMAWGQALLGITHASLLYEELYHDWRTVDFEMANLAAGESSKRRMIERIWMNY